MVAILHIKNSTEKEETFVIDNCHNFILLDDSILIEIGYADLLHDNDIPFEVVLFD